jgi:hypothetical protein
MLINNITPITASNTLRHVLTLALIVSALAYTQPALAADVKEEPPPLEQPEESIQSSGNAQPWIEYEQRQNTDMRLTALGPDLLGDQIDPNTGQIVFEHTDLILPGNSTSLCAAA